MNNISKVSDITTGDLVSYLRIIETDSDVTNTLNNLLTVAKNFIEGYTGHTEEELDSYPSFVIVVFILVQDMWDNRSLYVEKSNLSSVVTDILGMHSINLL